MGFYQIYYYLLSVDWCIHSCETIFELFSSNNTAFYQGISVDPLPFPFKTHQLCRLAMKWVKRRMKGLNRQFEHEGVISSIFMKRNRHQPAVHTSQVLSREFIGKHYNTRRSSTCYIWSKPGRAQAI